MSDMVGSRAPGWLRIVALLALLWNLVGVYFYLVHVDAIAGPAMSETDEAVGNSMPVWATACFAIGVFGGTLGSLGLLMLNAGRGLSCCSRSSPCSRSRAGSC